MSKIDLFSKDQKLFDLILSIPIICSLIIPIVIADIWLEIYHRTCFPLYNIPFISRKRYIKIDRHKLQYLSAVQKIGCIYCGYANGLLHYASVIAAATELYWCPIKHLEKKGYRAPKHHNQFAKYNELKNIKKVLDNRNYKAEDLET